MEMVGGCYVEARVRAWTETAQPKSGRAVRRTISRSGPRSQPTQRDVLLAVVALGGT